MISTRIKEVYKIQYFSPEEIREFDNGNEILNECLGMDKIPVGLLQFENDHEDVYFMLVVGEGALYSWKKGQKVETSFVDALISKLYYLSDMVDKGVDNSKYQNFCLYDTIIPIKPGHYFPEKEAKRYRGLFSFDLFKGLADAFYDNYH